MQRILSFPVKLYDPEDKRPIYVINCGYYQNIENTIPVSRPSGRLDYQILLPISGLMTIDRKEVLPGQIFLYRPHSPQEYTYAPGGGTEYYWIHFSGSEVDTLCDSMSLKTGVYPLNDGRRETERLVRMVIRAYSDSYKYADEDTAGLLRAILSLIASPPSQTTPFAKAIKLLRDPSCQLSISELAKSYEMSEGHFIRSFKQYVGVSPNSFRTANRIEIACQMLISTKMKVEQISHSCGYSDPLYFSRIFKKNIGVSPKEYRRSKRI